MPPTAISPRARVAIIATHIAPARGHGGIAECTARVARAWGDAGIDVILCASDASEGGPLRVEQLDMPACVRSVLYRSSFLSRWGFGLGAVPALWSACRQADRAYISGVGTWPTSLAGLFCRWLRRPFTIGVHGGLMAGHVAHIRTHKPLKWLFYQLITLPTLRRARAIHATSRIEADGVAALVPAAAVAIIPNAVDIHSWRPSPPRVPDGGLVIGYVGRLSPEKGILPFLEVWLATRRPCDRLIIAGTGEGDYAVRFAQLAANAGGAVECLGYVDAAGVRSMLARCDITILPSGMGEGGLRENFGNAVIESMALARPVLVTRGMAWDQVEAEGTGLAFDPSPAATAAMLRHVQTLSPAVLAAMGQAARQFVETRFSLEAVGSALWSVLTDDAALSGGGR